MCICVGSFKALLFSKELLRAGQLGPPIAQSPKMPQGEEEGSVQEKERLTQNYTVCVPL